MPTSPEQPKTPHELDLDPRALEKAVEALKGQQTSREERIAAKKQQEAAQRIKQRDLRTADAIQAMISEYKDDEATVALATGRSSIDEEALKEFSSSKEDLDNDVENMFGGLEAHPDQWIPGKLQELKDDLERVSQKGAMGMLVPKDSSVSQDMIQKIYENSLWIGDAMDAYNKALKNPEISEDEKKLRERRLKDMAAAELFFNMNLPETYTADQVRQLREMQKKGNLKLGGNQ